MGIEHDRFEGASPPWIVINTHAHREHLALDHLHRQEFEAYCPMIRKRRSHARRVDSVLRPLFPNYLFARFNDHRGGWRPILSTCGVRTIVRAGDRPSLIDDAFIIGLKSREIDGAIVRPATPYQIGERVRIAIGPFDKMVATIIDMDEKDRLVVLLELMNRGIRVKLDSHSVAPV
jgi:transcriptional antiterminator RfaH